MLSRLGRELPFVEVAASWVATRWCSVSQWQERLLQARSWPLRLPWRASGDKPRCRLSLLREISPLPTLVFMELRLRLLLPRKASKDR